MIKFLSYVLISPIWIYQKVISHSSHRLVDSILPVQTMQLKRLKKKGPLKDFG